MRKPGGFKVGTCETSIEPLINLEKLKEWYLPGSTRVGKDGEVRTEGSKRVFVGFTICTTS